MLVETWFDSDLSLFDEKLIVEVKANLCLMAKDDKVCNDDFDDYDTLQNEYDCLFNDFEKLMCKCKDFKKTITSLTLELDNEKNEYEIAIENRKNLK